MIRRFECPKDVAEPLQMYVTLACLCFECPKAADKLILFLIEIVFLNIDSSALHVLNLFESLTFLPYIYFSIDFGFFSQMALRATTSHEFVHLNISTARRLRGSQRLPATAKPSPATARLGLSCGSFGQATPKPGHASHALEQSSKPKTCVQLHGSACPKNQDLHSVSVYAPGQGSHDEYQCEVLRLPAELACTMKFSCIFIPSACMRLYGYWLRQSKLCQKHTQACMHWVVLNV